MKAKKLYTDYGRYSNIVTYEYRGRKYEVEYANDWTYCCSTPKIQHEIAQARIDELIERENKPRNGESYEVGLEMFFKFVEGEEV